MRTDRRITARIQRTSEGDLLHEYVVDGVAYSSIDDVEAETDAEILTDGGVPLVDEDVELLRNGNEAVNAAVGEVIETLEAGEEVTADDVKDIRAELDGLQSIVEERVVPHVDGVEPYETVLRNVTFGAMADALGIDLDDVNELRERKDD